MNYYRGSW